MHGPLLLYASYVALIGAALFVWQFWHRRKSKQRALEVLGWIDALICGEGRIADIKWEDSETLRLALRLRENTFHNASLSVNFIPRGLSLRRLWSKLRNSQETLVFEADLDWAPPLSLELQNYRLFARTRKDLSPEGPGWQFEQSIPFILTTRKDWQKEVGGVISNLVSCPDRQFLSIAFRNQSPHFCATLALDSIAPSSLGRTEIFDSLRILAAGASAPQV